MGVLCESDSARRLLDILGEDEGDEGLGGVGVRGRP